LTKDTTLSHTTLQQAARCSVARFTVAEWGVGSKNSGEPFSDLVMLVKAYFDDSADDQRNRFCAVGGLIGNTTQWDVFDNYWGISTSGIPGHFHATDCDCNPPRGVFNGWTKPQCDDLMAALVKIIGMCHLSGFGSVVPVPEFRAVFPGCSEYDPLYRELKHTIINMASIGARIASSSTFRSDGIQLWLEDGDTTVESVRIYQALKAVDGWEHRSFLKGFSTADKSVMALQGADLIAREAFKHADNRGVRRTRRPVQEMKSRMSFHVWNRECLEYLRDNGGPDNLRALTTWPNKRPPEIPVMTMYHRDGFDD
jgi:hypothetical protein